MKKMIIGLTVMFLGSILNFNFAMAQVPEYEQPYSVPYALCHKNYPNDPKMINACVSGWSKDSRTARDCTNFSGGERDACVQMDQRQRSLSKQSAGNAYCEATFNKIGPGLGPDAVSACNRGWSEGDSVCNRINTPTGQSACRTGAEAYMKNYGYNPSATNDPDLFEDTNNVNNNLSTAPASNNPKEISGSPGAAVPTTCPIGGLVGRLACGFADLTSKAADGALNILGAFMKFPPLETTKNDNPMYVYWSYFRNIANVIFVIVFLIVILNYTAGISQSSNISLKRLLPRIIIAAVFINFSYVICALMIDLSNVIGGTIYGMMASIVGIDNFSANSDGLTATLVNNQNALSWSTITSGILTVALTSAALTVFGAWAFLIPVLLFVLLAVIAVLLMLLLRQVFLIILVVISALAFSMMVLPNTRSLFEKWFDIFFKLLLLYPAVALIFGAGTIAMSIISGGAQSAHQPVKIMLQIMALGVQVLPLIVVPTLIGGASKAMNALQSRINKNGTRTKSATTLARNIQRRGDIKAENNFQNQGKFKQVMNDRRRSRLARQEASNMLDEAKKNLDQEVYLDDVIAKGSKKGASRKDQLLAREAKRLKFNLMADKVTAQMRSDSFNDLTRAQKLERAVNPNLDPIQQIAAAKALIDSGDNGAMLEMFQNMSGTDYEVRKQFMENIDAKGVNAVPFFSDPQVVNNFLDGNVTQDNFAKSVVIPYLENNDISPSQVLEIDPDAMEPIADVMIARSATANANQQTVISNPNLSPQTAKNHTQAIVEALNTPSLAKKIGKQRKDLEAVAAVDLVEKSFGPNRQNVAPKQINLTQVGILQPNSANTNNKIQTNARLNAINPNTLQSSKSGVDPAKSRQWLEQMLDSVELSANSVDEKTRNAVVDTMNLYGEYDTKNEPQFWIFNQPEVRESIRKGSIAKGLKYSTVPDTYRTGGQPIEKLAERQKIYDGAVYDLVGSKKIDLEHNFATQDHQVMTSLATLAAQGRANNLFTSNQAKISDLKRIIEQAEQLRTKSRNATINQYLDDIIKHKDKWEDET